MKNIERVEFTFGCGFIMAYVNKVEYDRYQNTGSVTYQTARGTRVNCHRLWFDTTQHFKNYKYLKHINTHKTQFE